MNRKELVQRWRNALGTREMFYYPVKKTKPTKVKYIMIQFKELKYMNYYDILNNYPEYSEQLSYYDKYRSSLACGYNSEAVFCNENHEPLFKMKINNGDYTIYNIPYGTYYVKIIKGTGYILNTYTIIVNEENSEKKYVIDLFRSYIKIKMGYDNGENQATIQEHNLYKDSDTQSPWLFDHLLSCDVQGRTYCKFYTNNDTYLGKVILGYSIYSPSNVGMMNKYYSFYSFTYFPISIYEKHITGNHTAGTWDYIAETFDEQFNEISGYSCGSDDSINMPIINKISTFRLIFSIKFTPNRDIVPDRSDITTNSEECLLSQSLNIQTAQYENLYNESTEQLERTFVGYNVYYEDGMDKTIHNDIIQSINISTAYQPSYIYILTDGSLSGSSATLISYEGCKESDEYTSCYYSNYPTLSEDYSSYDTTDFLSNYEYNFT